MIDLTADERTAVVLLSQGCSYRAISRYMGVKPHEVGLLLRAARCKLHAANGVHLVALALRQGLLDEVAS